MKNFIFALRQGADARLFWLLVSVFLLLVPRSFGQVFQRFSVREGAPVATVQGIAQDSLGFMWFATVEGLVRYDGRTFKKYTPKKGLDGSIASHTGQSVICDSKGEIWVATWGGLSRYERETDTFTNFRSDSSGHNSLSSNLVFAVMEDKKEGYWVGTANGLNHLTFSKGKPTFSRFRLEGESGWTNMVRCIAQDRNGILWLGTYDGLVRIQKDGKGRKVFKFGAEGRHPPINEFIAIYADNDGSIWLGSNRGGLIRFDTGTESFEVIEKFHRPADKLPNVSSIIPDGLGKFWVGTWSGLSKFDPQTQKSEWFYNDPQKPQSLPDDVLYALCIDKQGGVWAGSYYAGISYMHPASCNFSSKSTGGTTSLTANSFEAGWLGIFKNEEIWGVNHDRSAITFLDQATESYSSTKLRLPFAVTYNTFHVDDSKVLWCGGNSVLSRYDLKTHERIDYQIPSARPGEFSIGLVSSLHQDYKGRLWVGGVFGLSLFNRQKGAFEEHFIGQDAGGQTVSNRNIRCIAEDSKHNLWFGGGGEVFLLRAGAARFERIQLKGTLEDGSTVWRITEDNSGRIWFAMAMSGLYVYDPKTGRIVKASSPVENVLDVQTDAAGFLWINNAARLVRYHPDRHTVQYYDAQDGLPNQAVLRAATSIRDSKGVLFFSTNKEVFSFDPGKVSLNRSPSRIVITAVKVFSREITALNDQGILSKGEDRYQNLVFEYDQNVFSLDFALLSYFRSDRNRYAYKLEGFDKQWNLADYPSATYTNLSPGTYTFLVKAADGDGFWSNKPLRVRITVLPPWWQTWYAYLAYVLISTGVLYGIGRFFWLRTLFKKENELYQAKLDFFTNISHEIRTHLTLISSPLEKALRSLRVDSVIRGFLDTAKNNSDRLMTLVEELLDFRKIQTGSARFSFAEQDLVHNLRHVLAAFEHVMSEKQINMQLNFPASPVLVWIDAFQMQKVFYNLLSNAVKYTPEGGTVTISVSQDEDRVTVSFADNGPGIAAEFLPQLFTNFFQVYENGAQSNTGYGIGLALAKGIVDRHSGALSVTSRKASGLNTGETIFTMILPKGRKHLPSEVLADAAPIEPALAAIPQITVEGADVHGEGQHPVLLLIEDNDELRAFERETLRGQYQILEADNGQDGLAIAREYLPDLIVCDVMLPGLNGLEVCRKLKSDILTSHIPVIHLSAKATAPQILEGLQAGADDYLIKPFNLNVFETKIRNLISAKQVLRHWYSQSVLMEPDHVFVRNFDGEFVIRLKNLILENISDPDFGVKEMAFEIGTSVAVLYRKLRDLTGLTVNDFVKKIRMARALQLLESGQYNVSEVATIVGYESSKYFGREFKKVYGKTPNEVRRHGTDSDLS
ncbi:two-component regulator propeller domain-containing protein [Dyadobacter sp. OTU695]|uniref:two-component regulator propeller domain-containing protein n=1 Tax=Dyadobacter sp. OTU695 TaxID=3043860 RepID=UPI00313B6FF5